MTRLLAFSLFLIPSVLLGGFSLIPGGAFLMGDALHEASASEGPVHSVHVSEFYMEQRQVTRELWDEVRDWAASHGYDDLPSGVSKGANHPVHSMTWFNVVKWCNARSEKDGLTPCYSAAGAIYRSGSDPGVVCNWEADGYRLPTEAEWEKAARGGLEGKRYPWGNTISHAQCNYFAPPDGEPIFGNQSSGYHPSYSGGDFPYTAPVGSFAPNGYGIYDMAGNLENWCWDWYDSRYYQSSPSVDPRGPATYGFIATRCHRGGHWGDLDNCRTSQRTSYLMDQGLYVIGFRTARSSGGQSAIESLKPDIDGLFISGFGLKPNLKAIVDWKGRTPSRVEFRVNDKPLDTISGAGTDFAVPVSVDNILDTKLADRGNVITATAVTEEADGVSIPSELTMDVIPVPEGLRAVVPPSRFEFFGEHHVGFDFDIPVRDYTVNLPFVGKFGFEWGANASFDYTINDGEWEIGLGLAAEAKKGKRGRRPKFPGLTRRPKFKLYIGNKEIEVKLSGTAKGVATARDGIVLKTIGVSMELASRMELTRYGLLDLVGPGLTNLVERVMPSARKALKNVSIMIWLNSSLEGSGDFKVSPFDFEEATVEGTLGLEAAYEPEFGDMEGRVYLGGQAALTYGIPAPYFREVDLSIYAGIEFTAWVFTIRGEEVLVNYNYPGRAERFASKSQHQHGGQKSISGVADGAGWQVMDRPWRLLGTETFLSSQTGKDKARSKNATTVWEDFLRMGSTPPAARENLKKMVGGGMVGPDVPVQVELPLLGNIFPHSKPALDGRLNQLMLLYVRDTGVENSVQFTEVGWTFFNGTTWTSPAPVAADPRGQFEPKVAFDGHGAAVAVWTQVKDAGFAGNELEAMAAQMEIVSARWDAAMQTWSPATPLTDNSFLDHKPKLAGPLSDGDLLLTWRANSSNLLMGAGPAGDPRNSHLMSRRWDSATATWGAAQVLVPDLAEEMSDSLVAEGGKAVVVITKGLNGAQDDMSDSELFYRVWSEQSGTWGALTRHTTDGVSDRNARVAIGLAGDVYCLWQSGENLVMDVNFSGTPSLVREDSGTFGFSDLALAVGPGGNVVVIWQEMGEHGSDAHYRVYDPASETWGVDTFLSKDSDLEHSFAPVWDAAGNLTLAYNNVQMVKVTKNVVVEGGGVIRVDNVPQPGRVDLLVSKRALVKDLTLVSDGLTTDGTNFLPGDETLLKARVRNAGNFAAENVAVGFYDGDPGIDGVLIGTAIIPGWLRAGDEAEASLNWTIPEPARPRVLHVMVDPAGAVSEVDETNNTLALPLNGIDLELEYLHGKVLRDGSANLLVRVRNLSAPGSPSTSMRLKSQVSGSMLAEVAVGAMAPGAAVEIPIALPAGTHAEGVHIYHLVLDADELIEEVERDNNTVQFSLNLWIDDDRDGIPRAWELAHGMSDDNAADAMLDFDQDGFDNHQEYLAGTEPANASSKLSVGQFNVIANPSAGFSTSAVSWATVPGRLYKVQRSFDLQQWTTVTDNIEPTPPLNTLSDTVVLPSAGGRVFYRIVVK